MIDNVQLVQVDGESLAVRAARRSDLPELVAMLADDPLGSGREGAPLAAYEAAFALIDADPNQLLAVLAAADGTIVGTLQPTTIPGLSRGGALRGQIEAVRVHSAHRARGLGRPFVQWAIDPGGWQPAELASRRGGWSWPAAVDACWCSSPLTGRAWTRTASTRGWASSTRTWG